MKRPLNTKTRRALRTPAGGRGVQCTKQNKLTKNKQTKDQKHKNDKTKSRRSSCERRHVTHYDAGSVSRQHVRQRHADHAHDEVSRQLVLVPHLYDQRDPERQHDDDDDHYNDDEYDKPMKK